MICDPTAGCSASSPLGVVQVAVAATHACALFDDGTAMCWGNGVSGRLGTGDEMTRGLAASVCATGVAGTTGCDPLSGIVAIGAGPGGSSCALLKTGAVRCWGVNDTGQLGDGTELSRSNPARVCTSGLWNGSVCGSGSPYSEAALRGCGELLVSVP